MRRSPRVLVGIPVYNEQKYVTQVLDEIRHYADDLLVIDDGSTDETPMLLARQPVEVIRHAENRGYGRSMQDMLRWARFDAFDWLITMDCDEQHEPASIPDFLEAARQNRADIISGSRYLIPPSEQDSIGSPPPVSGSPVGSGAGSGSTSPPVSGTGTGSSTSTPPSPPPSPSPPYIHS